MGTGETAHITHRMWICGRRMDSSLPQGLPRLSFELSGETKEQRYLEQQFEAGDTLEGQNQEGLQGKTLADGVTLQLLQDLSETAVAISA